MLALLAHGDPAVRKRTAQDLGAHGAAARSAVPALIAAVADPVQSVRASAGAALCRIRAGEADIPALAAGLTSTDRDLRFWSARALATASVRPVAAIPALLEALQVETTLAIPDMIRWALKSAGPASVAPLVELLQSAEPAVRRRAVAALEGGSAARVSLAIPALLGALADPDAQVRQFAAQAFGSVGQEHPGQLMMMSSASTAAVRALGGCLGDVDERVRERAAWALMWLGAEARPAAAMLRSAMPDQDEQTQRWIAQALEHLAADPAE